MWCLPTDINASERYCDVHHNISKQFYFLDVAIFKIISDVKLDVVMSTLEKNVPHKVYHFWFLSGHDCVP